MNDKLAEVPAGCKPVDPAETTGWLPLQRNPRRPSPPAPIEAFELVHPAVPPQALGLSLLHVSDMHIRRGRPCSPVIKQAAQALKGTQADLVVLTGDYTNDPGDEAAALEALKLVAASCLARFGVWAIFGNHDSWEFKHEARRIPQIQWLTPERPTARPIPGLGLTLIGSDEPEDLFGIAASLARAGRSLRDEFCIALAHYPTEVYAASTLGIPIVLSGHTHGGQFRLTPRWVPHTSCDLPPHLASGILRHGDSLCCISRGLGQAIVEMRVNCPVQLPLYRLKRGELGPPAEGLTLRRPW